MNNLSKPPIENFLKILFFVEMWERFSYYGMRALLVLFLISHLGFTDQKSYAIYSLFAAIGYVVPIFSGYISDKYTGPTSLVFIGGVILMLGHILMTFTNMSPNLIYMSLGLIAVGTGFFKGNITNIVGSCYKENDAARSNAFRLFYVSINIGAFLSAIACSYVAKIYGWHFGFGLAAIGMFIGLCAFVKLQFILDSHKNLQHLKKPGKIFSISVSYYLFIAAIIFSFIISIMLQNSEIFTNILTIVGLFTLSIMLYIIYKLPKDEAKNLIALCIMILFLMSFFALEMQLGSLINLFVARNVENKIFNFDIPAAASQALNPLSIIIIGYFVGIKFNKKYASFQLLLGIFSMFLCFIILYIGTYFANIDSQIPYIFLVTAISIMGFGEVFISPFVQSQVGILAPKHLHGFVMGFLMLSLAFSNLFGIVISHFVSVPNINGEVDPVISLGIYKEAFLNIAILNIVICLIFFIIHKFLTSRINQKV
jgi:POT family proton-dependent oligopeptide transporter